ncbi:mitochondrial inner membrane protein OXA1L isoform X3 [Gopherus evgoodei]|uniref:OXA1L mitochondrial inner membrane protein n=1 Tax=Gopherus evgoodei TaxID=1825980 RepID=A0A8C4YL46_9SAUR|nr:mitochondrial inner membrane protein OXA1L isoform X3 [Gopherus evgoodei]
MAPDWQHTARAHKKHGCARFGGTCVEGGRAALGLCAAGGGAFPANMAASAAARRGWRRLGPPELAPLLRGLHTQVLPPAAASAPDLGGAVTGGELAEVPELGLAELGLGSYTPVGLIQNLLEFLHTDLGLPWWGAIVAGTVAARCLVFPLIVKGQREAAKLNNHLPEITRLTQCMQDAKRSGNQFKFSKSYSELSLYQKAHDVNPMRGFLVPLVQAPIFISFFIALREMAALPVPSMQSGGLAWFVDLTVADPLYVLPLVVTGTMWLILELGAESGVDNPNLKVMKTVFRVMPLVILPLTISFPTAVFTYWLTSNLFSLAQVGLLRVPAVRARLRIPSRVQHDPALLPPRQGFVQSLRAGWKDAQLAQQLQERERRVKNHLALAAKGPLRQTFSHNPLQQEGGAGGPGSSPRPKRPWQDTLG